MTPGDMMKTVVWRAGAPSQTDPGLNKMINQAARILKQTYFIERRSITIHLPEEDESFQKQHGGSRAYPVLVGLFNTEDQPIRIPNDLSLKMFQRLSEFVVPIFTSDVRAAAFVSAIKARGCMVPDHKLVLLRSNREMAQWIEQGNAIVNPIPEFVLTAFMAWEIDSQETVIFTTVVAPDPDDIREHRNPLDRFFRNR